MQYASIDRAVALYIRSPYLHVVQILCSTARKKGPNKISAAT